MLLFARTKVDKARAPAGSTMKAEFLKLTLPLTTIGRVGDGDALDEDEVDDATDDDGTMDELEPDRDDEELATKLPELVAVEEPVVMAAEADGVDVLKFEEALELETTSAGLSLYIWRRLPAPQYSFLLAAQSMLQSA